MDNVCNRRLFMNVCIYQCVIVIKLVAFCTICAKLTVAFTCTSLLLNLYTSVSGCGCGFGFQQKFWRIADFAKKKGTDRRIYISLFTPLKPGTNEKETPHAGKPSIKGCSSNLSAGLELRISLPVPAKHSLTCVNKAAEEIRNRRS